MSEYATECGLEIIKERLIIYVSFNVTLQGRLEGLMELRGELAGDF